MKKEKEYTPIVQTSEVISQPLVRDDDADISCYTYAHVATLGTRTHIITTTHFCVSSGVERQEMKYFETKY